MHALWYKLHPSNHQTIRGTMCDGISFLPNIIIVWTYLWILQQLWENPYCFLYLVRLYHGALLFYHLCVGNTAEQAWPGTAVWVFSVHSSHVPLIPSSWPPVLCSERRRQEHLWVRWYLREKWLFAEGLGIPHANVPTFSGRDPS